MKKLCWLFVMLFALVWISFATSPYKMITLYPGWNVVSTPAILSWIVFSNGWEWISFSKLSSWQWISVAATAENIRPLDWFMVYNNNSENVSMALQYKNLDPTESFLQSNLNYWWNLLWIVTTNSPFNNIASAVMSADFTDNGMTNNLNKVNTNYLWNSISSSINNPELWEAYWVFINQENAVYWAINNWGVEIPNCSSNSESAVITSASANTVLRKSSNTKLAEFIVKPSNGGCFTLSSLWISVSGTSINQIRVIFDWVEVDAESIIWTTWATYKPVLDLPVEGIVVKVSLLEELTGQVELAITEINGKNQSRTFSKRFEEAVVRIVAQQDIGWATKFILEVDADSDVTVSDFKYGTWGSLLTWVSGDFSDGETFEVPGIADAARYITNIQYSINGTPISVIKKDEYSDFFKIGDTYIRVFKAD